MVDASDSADGEISNVFLAYLTELIQADSQEEWIQTHGSSEDDIFAGNLSGVHWKERYIQQKFGIFLLFQPDAWVKKEGNYLFEKSAGSTVESYQEKAAGMDQAIIKK